MKRGFLVVLIISAVVVLEGCASTGVTKIKSAQSREEGCSLQIFTSESEIKRPFEVLCLLDTRTGTTAFHEKTGAAAIQGAKPEACKCGADGILVTAVESEGVTAFTWGQGRATLKAIRFTDQ